MCVISFIFIRDVKLRITDIFQVLNVCYVVYVTAYMEFEKHFQWSRKKTDRPLRQLTNVRISLPGLGSF